MTTKETIIYEALKLFSTNGFDAVSTRMIARAVGASDAVIYKHFRSKQEILDTIVNTCRQRLCEKRDTVDIHQVCWSDVEKICIDLFRFQTQVEWVVMFRRLLIIDQFKNPQMAELYRTIFIDIPINSMAKMFQELIQKGYLKEGNPRVYAMELYAPFFMYHTFQEDSEKLLKELEMHVTYFRINYKTEKCDE